jgi:DNA helicase-2/ATP-dependent DNA helicase PcrA
MGEVSRPNEPSAREATSHASDSMSRSGDNQIKGKAGKALAGFVKQIDQWRSLTDSMPLAALMDQILEDSGYRAMWQADKSPEAQGRVDNLRELVRALGEFATMEEFLEHISLVMDHEAENGPQAMISIMSLHAAKGLEFPVVFLTGWEEGLFPSQRTMDEKGNTGLEEERRLAYVGITRARRHCIISHAANRRIYNQWQSCIPSRFLNELPPEHTEILEGGTYSSRASGPALFQKGIDSFVKKGPKLNEAPPSPTGFAKGQKVSHAKFGDGLVLNIEGDHLTIAFKSVGKKKIMADFVQAA